MLIEGARSRVTDFRAVFGHRPFMLFAVGNTLAAIGFWMQRIAIGWTVWEITGSEAWLGLIAFAELFPSILTGILGGMLADRGSLVRLMIAGQAGIGAIALVLAVLAATDSTTPTAILIAMVALGATSGLVLPARLAMASHLAPPALLPSALAVNSTSFNLSRFVGPAIAAVVLIGAGPLAVYVIVMLCYGVFVATLIAIRAVPSQAPARTPGPAVATRRVMADLVATPLVFGVILAQLIQGIFMRPVSELFPAYADAVFAAGEGGLGLLNGALGIGAVIGALALSRARNTRSAMIQVFGGTAIFALTLFAFAGTTSLWLAAAILIVQGIAMSSSNIAAMAYVQTETPRERLGRVLSVYAIVFRVGPALGALGFGLTAELAGLAQTATLFAALGILSGMATIVSMRRGAALLRSALPPPGPDAAAAPARQPDQSR